MPDKLDRSMVLWYQNHRGSRMATTQTHLSRQYILQKETYLTIKRSQVTQWSFLEWLKRVQVAGNVIGWNDCVIEVGLWSDFLKSELRNVEEGKNLCWPIGFHSTKMGWRDKSGLRRLIAWSKMHWNLKIRWDPLIKHSLICQKWTDFNNICCQNSKPIFTLQMKNYSKF